MQKVNSLYTILNNHKLWLDTGGVEGERANLSGANLRYANLSWTNLSWANLSGAYLISAYLRDANLIGANLSGAYLSGADLRGANLIGADLRGAKFGTVQLEETFIILKVQNCGERNRNVFVLKNGYIVAGCFCDRLPEFKKSVAKKYGDDFGDYAHAIHKIEEVLGCVR